MSRKHDAGKLSSTGPGSHGRERGRRRDPGGGIQKSFVPWILAGIVIVLAVGILIFRPRQVLPSEITVAQAYEKYQAGALFLDVRSQEEWSQGHIANSMLIPLDELPNRLNEVPREQDIVVVCKSGARSKEGATILRQAGYTRVTCMTGGLEAWAAARYPVER